MNYEYYPYVGVNKMVYGMNRIEIRNILGIDFLTKEFYRSPLSVNSTDAFDKLGIFINYDSQNNCDSFEFFKPAKVIFLNKDLLKLSYNDFTDLVGYIDNELDESDDAGATSFLLGLGVYAPEKHSSPNKENESIITFKRGYYD